MKGPPPGGGAKRTARQTADKDRSKKAAKIGQLKVTILEEGWCGKATRRNPCVDLNRVDNLAILGFILRRPIYYIRTTLGRQNRQTKTAIG